MNKIFVEKTPKLPMFHSKLQTKNNSRSLHHVVGVGRKDTVDLVALQTVSKRFQTLSDSEKPF